MEPSRYQSFTRPEWARLRANTPLTLTERDLDEIRGINEHLDLDEVRDIYLPLSRLLNLYVTASAQLQRVSELFVGGLAPKVPYVIGVAGSVAVGKSTTSRILQALLSRWPAHPKVALVTTDGFLYPNAVLGDRNLMNRKGFPESYDVKRLLRFLLDLKSGAASAEAPQYSHVVYDVLPETETVKAPDILILEGINVLQTSETANDFVSDYFDFSIYVDADERDIEQWYVERFLTLRETVFTRSDSYFRRYAELDELEAIEMARSIWQSINGKNLSDNIQPTRGRASLILRKGPDHRVTDVRLRSFPPVRAKPKEEAERSGRWTAAYSARSWLMPANTSSTRSPPLTAGTKSCWALEASTSRLQLVPIVHWWGRGRCQRGSDTPVWSTGTLMWLVSTMSLDGRRSSQRWFCRACWDLFATTIPFRCIG
jgi:type I pantothenate kinase